MGFLSVPPAPLLGGGLILYAEMLLLGRFSSVEMDIFIDQYEEQSKSQVAASLRALASLERMKGVTLVGSDRLKARGEITAGFRQKVPQYEPSDPTLDSPASLVVSAQLELLEIVRFQSEVSEKALNLLGRGSSSVLCVHANSVPRPTELQETLSLGDEDEWIEGIRAAIDNGLEKQILFVGSDSQRLIAKLDRPGSIAPQTADFTTQLACVHYASGFLGMSSGPATVAMFSTTPYIVFKHPSHHSRQMETLLFENKYPFALSSQLVRRAYPDREAIEEACFLLAELSV